MLKNLATLAVHCKYEVRGREGSYYFSEPQVNEDFILASYIIVISSQQVIVKESVEKYKLLC